MTATRHQARAAVARLAAAPVPLVDPGFVARVAQQLGDLDLDELTIELTPIGEPLARPTRPVGRAWRATVPAGGTWRPSRTGWTLGGLGLVMATVVAAVALGGARTSTTVRVNDPGTNESIASTIAPVTSTAATTEVTARRPTSVPGPVPLTTASAMPTPPPVTPPADPGAVGDPTGTGPSPTPVATRPSSNPSNAAEPSIAPAVPPATRPPSAPAPVSTSAATSAPAPSTTLATTTESTTPATMTLTCASKVVTGQPVVICEWSEVAGAASYALLKGPNGRVLSPNPGNRRVEDHDVALGSSYTYVVWARDAAGRNLAHSPLITVACCPA